MTVSTTYSPEYLQSCRDRIDAQVLAYREVADAVKDSKTADATTLAALERAYFGNLVLAIDGYFRHRGRGREGKNGNPANEVRMLATSILENDGKLVTDPTVTITPESSILGFAAGDTVIVTEESFMHLAFAYLNEIESRYGG
jgi:hypothetical protein